MCIGQTPGDRGLLGSAAGAQLRRRTAKEQIVDVVGESRRRAAQPSQLAHARVAMHQDCIVSLVDIAADQHVSVNDRIAADLILRPQHVEQRANSNFGGERIGLKK